MKIKKIKKIAKNTIKRILCKINPTYRLISRINDLNKKTSDQLNCLIEKNYLNQKIIEQNITNQIKNTKYLTDKIENLSKINQLSETNKIISVISNRLDELSDFSKKQSVISNDFYGTKKINIFKTKFGDLYFYDFYTAEETNFLVDSILKINENNIENAYNFNQINFKENDIVIDIGANIGLVSLYLAKKYPNIKIYSFEPVKNTYNLLLQNIEVNKITNIHPFNLAITKDGREIEMIISKERNLASCNLETMPQEHTNFVSYHNGEIQFAKSISLDKFIKDKNIQNIKLLKIDCEGGEAEILLNTKNLKKIENIRGELHCNREINSKIISNLQKNIDPNKIKFEYHPLANK